MKWIGAALIILSCGAAGLQKATAERQRAQNFRQLLKIVDYLECELAFRRTALSDMCRQAAQCASGRISRVFTVLSEELDAQISPSAQKCMQVALAKCGIGEGILMDLLSDFGQCLGKFDYDGQKLYLDSLKNACNQQLDEFEQNRDVRLRSYQTLGLCVGAGLAILFI